MRALRSAAPEPDARRNQIPAPYPKGPSGSGSRTHLPQLAWRPAAVVGPDYRRAWVFDVPLDEAFHYPDGEGGRT
jgi:hypothetical protein